MEPRPRSWTARAAALARAIPLDRLQIAAIAAMRNRPVGETIAIACSGGADSLALLLLLWAHFPERRGSWLVLHFDHRLRGAASAADARFVQAVARALGEPCAVGRWGQTHAKTRPPGNKIAEAAAREARWGFFRDRMAAAGARVVALGHQRNDVAESMLMRLARGSGTGGLAAPRPVQAMPDGAQRVRPLLELTAAELREGLNRAGAPWREDASNAQGVFFRNRVRARVLPALCASSPSDALEGFATARARLEEDDEALQAWARDLMPVSCRGEPFDVTHLRGRPSGVVRRVLHAWLALEGVSEVLTRAPFSRLLEAVVGGVACRMSAGVGGEVVLAGGHLRLQATSPGDPAAAGFCWPESRLRVGEKLTGLNGATIAASQVRLRPERLARILAGRIPPDDIVFVAPDRAGARAGFFVRSWRPGDAYRPLGAPGRAKLQDLFVNRKIARDRRATLPVVIGSAGTVIWVPGLPPAHETALKSGARVVVQLTYSPPGNIVPAPLSKKTHSHVRSRQT